MPAIFQCPWCQGDRTRQGSQHNLSWVSCEDCPLEAAAVLAYGGEWLIMMNRAIQVLGGRKACRLYLSLDAYLALAQDSMVPLGSVNGVPVASEILRPSSTTTSLAAWVLVTGHPAERPPARTAYERLLGD